MWKIRSITSIFLVVLALVSVLIKNSSSFRWEDEDSVIVEGDWNRRVNGKFQRKWPWLESRSRADMSDDLPCYTTLGEQGHCLDIRECFPSLSDLPETSESQTMLETLKSMAGPCDTSYYHNFRIDLLEGLICCANRPPSNPANLSSPESTTNKFIQSPLNIPVQILNSSMSMTEPNPETEKKSFVPDAVAAFLYNQRLPTCGYLNETLNKTEKRYPWIVALVDARGLFCAGTLISRYFVLSSSSCVSKLTSKEISNMRVYLGDYKLHTTSDGPAIIRKVSRVIYHRSFSQQTLENDIALLKFKLPAPIGTPKVSPICLPDAKSRLSLEESDEHFRIKATLAGWGRSWIPSPTPVLQNSVMTIWTNEDCRIKYGYLAQNGISENMMCASADSKARKDGDGDDATDCIGDSGGPLTVTGEDGIARQVGIVSWNIGCGNYPYVYTRVSRFLPWIEKNILKR